MAIANGTASVSANSLTHIIWLPHDSHAGMSLPIQSFCGCRYLATSRESKAHFGIPWVRPWDNRGKCYMDGKRIQCWSNASLTAYTHLSSTDYELRRQFDDRLSHFDTIPAVTDRQTEQTSSLYQ